jgi:hypothetical protein
MKSDAAVEIDTGKGGIGQELGNFMVGSIIGLLKY